MFILEYFLCTISLKNTFTRHRNGNLNCKNEILMMFLFILFKLKNN